MSHVLKRWRIVWAVLLVVILIVVGMIVFAEPKDDLAFLRDLRPEEVQISNSKIPILGPNPHHALRFHAPAEQVGARLGFRAETIKFMRTKSDRKIPAVIGTNRFGGKQILMQVIRPGEGDFTCQVWVMEEEPAFSKWWRGVRRRLGLR